MKKTAKLFLSFCFLTMCFSCSATNLSSQEKETQSGQNSEVSSTSVATSNGGGSLTSNIDPSIGKHEDCTGVLSRFPQEELNKFYGYQEVIPSYTSDSYSYEGYYYTEGGYHVFDISSVVSENASAASYKAICEQEGLTINDEYYLTNGIYITQSVNGIYQLQFGEYEGMFFVDVYDNAEESTSGDDVQVNQVNEFPQAQLDAYMGFIESVPSYEASLYNYIETTDTQGYKAFVIFSDITSTASALNYKSICEQNGLTIDNSYVSNSGMYITYSANGKYYIQFYENNGAFYIEIYDETTSSGGETIPTGEGESNTFPQELLDEFFNQTELIPVFEASSYGYFYGENDYGDAIFEIYAPISETASTNAYKTICEANGLEIYDEYFVSEGIYITFSSNNIYQIQFGEYEGEFTVSIFLY